MLFTFIVVFLIGFIAVYLHSDYYKNIVERKKSDKKYMPNGSILSLFSMVFLLFASPKGYSELYISNVPVGSIIVVVIAGSFLIAVYTLIMEYKEFKKEILN
jgi:amino acid transporter